MFQLGDMDKEIIPILAHISHKLSEVAKDIRAELLFFKLCKIHGSFLLVDCHS